MTEPEDPADEGSTASGRAAETDVLGAPYTRETIELPDDYEGAVVATLVQRPAQGERRGAVLHVHGFCDYFFQTGIADFYTLLGYDFYALDLRKHGRSLLPHQTPNFCLDLAEYDAELNAATALIRARSGFGQVLVDAHSTGGLITALWARRRIDAGDPVASALVLDSPWLDLQGSFLLRTAGTEAINRLGQRRPYATIPRTVSGVYVESLHRDFHGEWDFDFGWKPRESFPVKAGWLRAIRLGHRAVHRGVDLPVPVLVLCSNRSLAPESYSPEAQQVDTVLDVAQIARWSYRLSSQVTLVRLAGAMHDVFLSRPEVRAEAYRQAERWLAYALPSGG